MLDRWTDRLGCEDNTLPNSFTSVACFIVEKIKASILKFSSQGHRLDGWFSALIFCVAESSQEKHLKLKVKSFFVSSDSNLTFLLAKYIFYSVLQMIHEFFFGKQKSNFSSCKKISKLGEQ
jgi:hypothetical protein